MKIGYQLNLEQTQKLSMTPELIQAIQILQYTNYDLLEFVKNELVDNPLLEVDSSKEADVVDIREKIIEDRYYEGSFKSWEDDSDRDEEFTFEQFVSEETTLHDFMMEQLSFSNLSHKDTLVAKYIIDALDDNGYLTSSESEIAHLFGISEEEVENIIEEIQSFEPLGVCARNLCECLEIQLRGKGLLTDDIEYIIENMLEEVAMNKVSTIAKRLKLKANKVQEIFDLIKTLEPKPGKMFYSGESTKYVIPDILVEEINGEYVVSNNESSVPHLMVSSYYNKLLKDAKEDEELNKYLTDRLNSAVWLIKSIEQRKNTIYNVAEAIVNYQIEFFNKGVKYLKPLNLKHIAKEVGVHESTVSRSINGKYMETPRGLFELKFFFSSGVTGGGEGISSNSIKAFIKSYIDNEDPKKPISDQCIVERLAEEGIEISRRTVAKYREGMGIAGSSKRRRF